MPYTKKQRAYFHYLDENPEAAREHGTKPAEAHRLASEADRLAREGRERKPVRKATFIDLSGVYDHDR